MSLPADLLYSKDHEWVRMDGDVATIGITDYAQDSLGDIVYVELPSKGTAFEQFKPVGVIESVKAVSEIFTPLGGEVIETNKAINDDPATVNRDPYDGGWLFKLKLANKSEQANLLSPAAYDELVKNQ